MKIERRFLPVTDLEIRSGDEESRENPKIEGYAAVFNSISEVMSDRMGAFREVIKPGAFKNTLNHDVRALYNHDPNFVLGRTKSNTLRLSEDEKGLRFSIDVPDTTWAKDLMVSIRRGDVNQCSFGFKKLDDEWTDTKEGRLRELRDLEIFDISCVTYPAYPQTQANIRSLFSENDFNELSDYIKELKTEIEELRNLNSIVPGKEEIPPVEDKPLEPKFDEVLSAQRTRELELMKLNLKG